MKRVLTKRGYAQFQAGTKSLEELLSDPNFSVELKEGMKTTSMPVNASVASSEEGEQSEIPVVDPQMAEKLKSATEELTALQGQMVTMTTAAEQAAARIAELGSQLSAAQAELASARPLMESAVNGIQMRLKGGTKDLSKLNTAELVTTFSSLSSEFLRVFPNGQVSVVEGDDNRQEMSVPLNTGFTEVAMRANRVGKK